MGDRLPNALLFVAVRSSCWYETRPEITAAMTSYIDLHRHAAVRSALAANTGVALRVMVAHAICGSPLWGVRVQDQRSRNEAISRHRLTRSAAAWRRLPPPAVRHGWRNRRFRLILTPLPLRRRR